MVASVSSMEDLELAVLLGVRERERERGSGAVVLEEGGGGGGKEGRKEHRKSSRFAKELGTSRRGTRPPVKVLKETCCSARADTRISISTCRPISSDKERKRA